MREILFKAKRTDNEEWVEGDLIQAQNKKYIAFGWSIDNEGEQYYNFDCALVHEVEPETICQYTGLTDKNKVKAFECDKVYDPHEQKTFTIKWDRELAAFVLEDDEGWFYSDIARLFYCEIIGNIYDNTSTNHQGERIRR